jgi:hypothetical protein
MDQQKTREAGKAVASFFMPALRAQARYGRKKQEAPATLRSRGFGPDVEDVREYLVEPASA